MTFLFDIGKMLPDFHFEPSLAPSGHHAATRAPEILSPRANHSAQLSKVRKAILPVVAIALIAAWGIWTLGPEKPIDVPPEDASRRAAFNTQRAAESAADISRAETSRARFDRRTAEGRKAISSGEGNEAARYYFAAFSIARERLAEAPGDQAWQDPLRLAFGGLTDSLFSSDGSHFARQCHDKALASLEKLAQANPENSRWQMALQSGYDRIAKIAAKNGDLVEARKFHEMVLKIAEDRAMASPDDPYGPWSVANTSFALVEIALRSGDINAARLHLDIARSRSQKALALGNDSFASSWSEILRQMLRDYETRLIAAEAARESPVSGEPPEPSLR